MLPRWHIILGALFAGLLYVIAPEINKWYLLLVFLASVLIDFDHYAVSCMKTGKYDLKESFDYHEKMGIQEMQEKKKGIRRRGDFHLFHTIEFHVLIALLGIFWTPFFFIFIGMVFHTLLDLISMMRAESLYRREFFFFNWLGRRF